MPHTAAKADIRARFLEELSDTLDVEKTIKKMNMTREAAREILRGLLPQEKAPRRAVAVRDGAFDIFVDGASRGNPGKAGAGAVIKDPDGGVLRELKGYLGVTTNNVAEYRALLMALEAAHAAGIQNVSVHADSELMVKQLNGIYKVKSTDLRPLFIKAIKLIREFKGFKITHVPREKNGIADGLANEAIDGHE